MWLTLSQHRSSYSSNPTCPSNGGHAIAVFLHPNPKGFRSTLQQACVQGCSGRQQQLQLPGSAPAGDLLGDEGADRGLGLEEPEARRSPDPRWSLRLPEPARWRGGSEGPLTFQLRALSRTKCSGGPPKGPLCCKLRIPQAGWRISPKREPLGVSPPG